MLGNLVMNVTIVATIIVVAILFLFIVLIIKWYKKPVHGRALVRSGRGGTRISFEKGFFVIPVLHRLEIMDITIKTVTISRTGVDGLICKDNMRADIKVTFFVRVNNTVKDATQVALNIGCTRASHQETLEALFDAKFSEALKTVGKGFDFVELYTERKSFKEEIINIIGTDLNGYVLDDCAIDYLEQTPLASLKADNILDSEGIKKITELTAEQQILANKIQREKQKTIKEQDVEARETILQLERQLAEKEEQQRREIANIRDKEAAEIKIVSEKQRLASERVRIESDQLISVAEENRQRQIIVAERNKQQTDAIETEKVNRVRELEINERERIVSLERIKKERAIEEERKGIEMVIRERVSVERDRVQEEEKIKDTKAFASADRDKTVAITNAEMLAQEALVKQIKAAEAQKEAAEFNAQTRLIDADAALEASTKEAEAKKKMAEAQAAEEAAIGLAEAQVQEAKAMAKRKDGETEAINTELKAEAEAKGIKAKGLAEAEAKQKIGLTEAQVTEQQGLAKAKVTNEQGLSEANVSKEKGLAEATIAEQKGLKEANVIKAKAEATEQQGLAEAHVIHERLSAEAKGIQEKADAMKKLDEVGKDHEEFKLRLDKDKQVELALINIQKDIASAQASVISSALKAAKIDIVGGETMFFEKIIGSITRGKTIDKLVESSNFIGDVKNRFLNEKNDNTDSTDSDQEDDLPPIDLEETEPESISRAEVQEDKTFKSKLTELVELFKLSSKELRNITIGDLIDKLIGKASDAATSTTLEELMEIALKRGINKLPAKSIGIE